MEPVQNRGPHHERGESLVEVLVALAILLFIGQRASRRMKDVKDYFAAGKKLSFWAVAFSARLA